MGSWCFTWVLSESSSRRWFDDTISCTYHLQSFSCFATGKSVVCFTCGSSFEGFSIVFPAPWLAKVESSQKSNGMWFFRHFFAPHMFHCNRNNRRDKPRSKFWLEKMFRKPHLKPLRWCSVRGTNKKGCHFLVFQAWGSKQLNHLFIKLFIIYLQSECTEKHKVELRSKYDRETWFWRHIWTSRTLSQTQVDMLEAFKRCRATG